MPGKDKSRDVNSGPSPVNRPSASSKIRPATRLTAFGQAAPSPADQLTLPFALARVPLLPSALLKRHHCLVATDTRFRAAARLLQSLWRTDAGFAVGLHASPAREGKPIKLGSRLDLRAARSGANFISPEVLQLVRRELIMREEGAVIDIDRLFQNALSSMPLSFNVLGPMALNLDLATVVWRRLLPSFVHSVESIGFEHSPGRGEARFLADGTAFDAVIRVVTIDGEQGAVYVEVKYSEGMTGPAAPRRHRYDEASREVRLFQRPDSPALRSLALEQLWREHMLAQLAVDHKLTPRAQFVAIGPRLNRRVDAAFRLYAAELIDPSTPEAETRVGFIPITLEAVIEAMAEAGAGELTRQLWSRYLDFGRVYQLALAGDVSNVGLKRSATRSSSPSKKITATASSAPFSEISLDDPPAASKAEED